MTLSNPFVKIARLFVEETANDSISNSALSSATTALVRLILRECTYADAVDVCLSTLNTDEPARRVHAILNLAYGGPSESITIPRQLSKRCRLWSTSDDARLLAGLMRYGPRDWKRIAEFVGNGKTGSQCSQRWSRALNPELSKEQWTEEEDEELWDGVQTHGQHSWAKVAQRVRSRSDVQCRYRYDQLKRMRKGRQRRKIVKATLRLLEDPFELDVAELIPPLIDRKHKEPGRFQSG
jgi:hypothetical protein